MTFEEIKNCLRDGEGLRIEFKQCRSGCPNDLYETIVSFSNKEGGTVLLGVSDDGAVKGIDPAAISQIKKDIVTTCNNPEKINPAILITPIEIEFQGRKLLAVKVPVSSQVHRLAGVIYDRENDSDLRITDPSRISEMYFRKRSIFTERQIFPALTFDDLDPELFRKVRAMIRSTQSDHPWLLLDDMAMLRCATLYCRDFKTGSEGFSLAAALLFGKDETIQNLLPAYKIDALVRRENLDRWDDRLTLRTNLIDSYLRLMEFIRKHLPGKFYLEGDRRRDLRDLVFRELIGNCIVHREYTNPLSTEIIIYKEKVIITNPNRAMFRGALDIHSFSPFAKNPNLRKFFNVLSWADEIGSGIRNVSKYLPLYVPGARPLFFEDDVFRTEIPLVIHTWQPFAESFVRTLGGIPEDIIPKLTQNLGCLPLSSDPGEASFEAFLINLVSSWAEKGTKLIDLQLQQNQEISKKDLKKVPSLAEKGTKLFHKRAIYLLKILLMALKPASLNQIMEWISYKNRKQFRDRYLKPLLREKLVEYTIPEKPSSEKQQYVTTEKGKRFLGGFDV